MSRRNLSGKSDRQHREAKLQPGSSVSPPSGMAILGVILSIPVAAVAIIALSLVGRPITETLLIALALQVLVVCSVIAAGLFRMQTDAQPQPDDVGSNEIPPEDIGIWRSYARQSEIGNAVRVALISSDTSQSRSIARNLVEIGYEVHHSTDSDAMLETVQARPGDWGIVIFDMDLPPDIDTGVDDLMDFRMACPELPVLLLSSLALRDDFSDHRRMIGDATLRKPVFRKSLVEGIEAVTANFTRAC